MFQESIAGINRREADQIDNCLFSQSTELVKLKHQKIVSLESGIRCF